MDKPYYRKHYSDASFSSNHSDHFYSRDQGRGRQSTTQNEESFSRNYSDRNSQQNRKRNYPEDTNRFSGKRVYENEQSPSSYRNSASNNRHFRDAFNNPVPMGSSSRSYKDTNFKHTREFSNEETINKFNKNAHPERLNRLIDMDACVPPPAPVWPVDLLANELEHHTKNNNNLRSGESLPLGCQESQHRQQQSSRRYNNNKKKNNNNCHNDSDEQFHKTIESDKELSNPTQSNEELKTSIELKLKIPKGLSEKQRKRVKRQAKRLQQHETPVNAKEAFTKIVKQELKVAEGKSVRRKEGKLRDSRTFNIMDVNISSGKIPGDKYNIFLAAWKNILQNVPNSGENFIESSGFSDGKFIIILVNLDLLPQLKQLVLKLPTLWPNALLRLIPCELKRATMFFPKGTISKSNKEILQILAEQNSIRTDQWVIYFRTPIELKDFVLLGIDYDSAEYFEGGIGHLQFQNRTVTIKLSRNDAKCAIVPTKKELRHVIKAGIKLRGKTKKLYIDSIRS